MANARGKAIDNTHLSIDQAEQRGFIHRDYIAHCLRWSHVSKFLREKNRYKTAVVLDVGCGKDLPLARMLHTSRMTGCRYIGVDYNKHESLNSQNHEFGSFNAIWQGDCSFPDAVTIEKGGLAITSGKTGKRQRVGALPTVITCFEMLEHIEPAHARAAVSKMAYLARASEQMAKQTCDIFISTPNWDPKVGAADNHVNEMLYPAVQYLLETSGLEVINVWGTFASQKDYRLSDLVKDTGDFAYDAGAALNELWDGLSKYYDSNYLATIFAPLFPAQSRNCLWHCRVADYTGKAKKLRNWSGALDGVKGPWTSSDKWKELSLTVIPEERPSA